MINIYNSYIKAAMSPRVITIQIIEEEGTLSVDCSFCNKRYEYDREQITKIFARKADISH